jgi:hypothetical protein
LAKGRVISGGKAHLSAANDPQMLAAAALLDRLRATALQVSAYTFFGTPHWLDPWAGGDPIPLPVLTTRQGGSRLLVLSDGSPFYDPFTDTAHLPTGFESFPVRVLLTPLPRANWGWREHALERGGWRLAEQSTDGVADAARWLAGPREVHPLPPLLQPPLPQLPNPLQREDRFFADAPPSEEMRLTLRDELIQWLDPDPNLPPDTYDLLCCLAIGVHLSPGTVEQVIAHLRALGAPLSNEAGLRRLLRLPWFTRGYLPAWLRDDLLRDLSLSPSLADKARQAWLLHLADLTPGHGKIDGEQERRLRGEVQMRLIQDAPLADARMRAALRIEAPIAARPVAREVVLGLLLTLVSAAASMLLYRYAQHLPEVLDVFFTPLRWWAGDRPIVLALLAPTIAGSSILQDMLGRRYRVGRVHAGSMEVPLNRLGLLVPIYIACGLWWIERGSYFETWTLPNWSVLTMTASIVATAGLGAIALVGLPVGVSPFSRATITSGHPWANFVSLLLLVGLSRADLLLPEIGPTVTVTSLAGTTLVGLTGFAVLVFLQIPRALGAAAGGGAALVVAVRAAGVAAIVAAALFAVTGPVVAATNLITQDFFWIRCWRPAHSPHCTPRDLSPGAGSRLATRFIWWCRSARYNSRSRPVPRSIL